MGSQGSARELRADISRQSATALFAAPRGEDRTRPQNRPSTRQPQRARPVARSPQYPMADCWGLDGVLGAGRCEWPAECFGVALFFYRATERVGRDCRIVERAAAAAHE